MAHLQEVRNKIAKLRSLEKELERIATTCSGGVAACDCAIIEALADPQPLRPCSSLRRVCPLCLSFPGPKGLNRLRLGWRVPPPHTITREGRAMPPWRLTGPLPRRNKPDAARVSDSASVRSGLVPDSSSCFGRMELNERSASCTLASFSFAAARRPRPWRRGGAGPTSLPARPSRHRAHGRPSDRDDRLAAPVARARGLSARR